MHGEEQGRWPERVDIDHDLGSIPLLDRIVVPLMEDDLIFFANYPVVLAERQMRQRDVTVAIVATDDGLRPVEYATVRRVSERARRNYRERVATRTRNTQARSHLLSVSSGLLGLAAGVVGVVGASSSLFTVPPVIEW